MNNLKKAISIFLVISILVLTGTINHPVSAAGFTDVAKSAWYYTYVNRLVELSITAGVGNNKFAPSASVTRAEFVTFLCKSLGLAQSDGYTFSDTKEHWASEWISTGVTANIISEGITFSPNKAITRQEAVEMLCRALGLAEDTSMTNPYTDVPIRQGYSNTAYKEYLMLGTIANNERYFYPSSDIKRSEVSAVIVNLVDYKADTVKYKTIKKAEVDKQTQTATESQAEAKRYAAWKDSVKDIPTELLNNTSGLYCKTLYDSYKYPRETINVIHNWGYDIYGMTDEQFENEIIKVATTYENAYANANYKNINEFEKTLRYILYPTALLNHFQDRIDYITNNTVVSEGKFITSKGLIVEAKSGQPALRGTIRYRYSSPTSTNLLKTETIGSTKEPSKLGVWYEQDVELDFSPEINGLKVISVKEISKIRTVK